jgi:polyphenol oxidase
MWKSSKLENFTNIKYGFSDRSSGNLSFKRSKTGTLSNRKKFFRNLNIDIKKLVSMEMLHGTQITKVSKLDGGRGAKSQDNVISDSDGLYTFEQDVVLFGTYADCLPIYLYEPNSQIVALLHAGWRGVASKIIISLAQTLRHEGIKTKDCIIVVGPHIQQCCFEVGEEVLEQFQQKYTLNNRINLKECLLSQLIEEKFKKENIEISEVCTLHNNRFYSHRREGNTGANCAFITRI